VLELEGCRPVEMSIELGTQGLPLRVRGLSSPKLLIEELERILLSKPRKRSWTRANTPLRYCGIRVDGTPLL